MEKNENELTKMFYKIGEVADYLDVTESSLRFWEKEFDDIPGFFCIKNDKGTRKYTQKNIDNIKTIVYLLKDKKLTIEGAKKYIKDNNGGRTKEDQLIEHLDNVRNYLLGQIGVYDDYIKKESLKQKNQ